MAFDSKGQSAIEFLILVGAVIVFIVGFLIAAQYSVGERTRQNKDQVLGEVAFTLQDEITIAQGAPDGYFRQFDLPERILTSEYDVNVAPTGLISVTTTDEKYSIAVAAPPVMGNAQTGDNEIRKEGGKVCLNVPYNACVSCGNGEREDVEDYPDEECDGSDFLDPLCSSSSYPGFESGKVECTFSCLVDTSPCGVCGDSKFQFPGEQCDNGESGPTDGCDDDDCTLHSGWTCTHCEGQESICAANGPEECDDGLDNDCDGLIDVGEDSDCTSASDECEGLCV